MTPNNELIPQVPLIAPALLNCCHLIKLRSHEKVALESGWNKDANYSPEDPEILRYISDGGNYGIMPTNGLIVIDCDTQQLYDDLPKEWKETLTVITGREGETGRHIFLYCPESAPEKIPLTDPETNKPLGDIRGTNSPFYTVGAGSIHPSGKKYRYVNPESGIFEVKWTDVLEWVKKYSPPPLKNDIPTKETKPFSIGSSLSEKLGLRIEDFAMPVNPKKMPSGDIQGEHPVHGSSTGMNFAINTTKNVWHCYRCSTGGDPVAWIAYVHCGVPETECNNLSIDQFKAVKEWLKNNGYSKQITDLDDKFHAPPPEIAKIDISKLTQVKKPEFSEEDVEKAKKDAEARSNLPPFPGLEPGIFKDYIDYGKHASYSLEEFHFAAILTLASLAIRRKAVIEVGPIKFHTNVFTMIVGQTSISGKSVACDMAVDSFEKSVVYEEPVTKFNSTNIFRGTVSEPALIQSLNDVFNSLWYYDDCGGFFDDIPAWNAHIIGTLCTAYDGRQVERSLSNAKKSKKDEEKNKWSCPTPFLSLLFNMTTNDVERIASARFFSSGFFPRFLWFYGQGGAPRKNTKVSSGDKEIVASIALKIKNLRQSLRVIPDDGIIFEVCDIIETWANDSVMSHLKKKDELYRVCVGRSFAHVYKLAAIFSLFDPEFQELILNQDKYPIEVSIPEKHAKMAIKIVEQYLIPRMMHIQEMCTGADLKNHRRIVLNAITELGGHATRTELINHTFLDKGDLDKATATLEEAGKIKIFKAIKDGNCKPTTTYIKL